MPNINYAVAVATSSSSTNAAFAPLIFSNTTNWTTLAPTTGGFNYVTALSTTNVTDAVYSCFVVFSS
jgi:hypothetical protein